MADRQTVAPVPQIRLIDSVSALTHIDRLESCVELGEQLTPGMIIVDSVSEGEGVAGADPAQRSGGRITFDRAIVTKALRVAAKVDAGSVQVRDVEVRYR